MVRVFLQFDSTLVLVYVMGNVNKRANVNRGKSYPTRSLLTIMVRNHLNL